MQPQTKATLTAVIVEIDPQKRDALHGALQKCPSVHILGTFGDVQNAITHIPELKPDVAVIHVEPGIGVSNFHLALQLRQQLPKLGVVLISDHRIISAISLLPRAEAPGWSYLLRDTIHDAPSLQRSLQGAVDRMVMLDPNLISPATEEPSNGLLRLTPRQLKTLQLMAEGFTNQAIADTLAVSIKSVENHVNQIYQELEIDRTDRRTHPRIRAVNMYLTQHFIDPKTP